MHSDEGLRAKLAALRKGELSPEELNVLVHELGRAMFLEAEPDVVALLDHPDWWIRQSAVWVLTYDWDVSRHRDKLIHLVRHDPAWDVRLSAGGGLGWVFRDSHDPVVSQALIERIRNQTEDPKLRETAYEALRQVWSPYDPEQARADFRAMIHSDKESEKAFEAARSHEERQGLRWMWRQESLLKIDWEFVERVERSIQGKDAGSGQSPTGEFRPR